MLSPSSRDVTRELLTPLRAAHVQATPSLMTTVVLFVNHAATVADLGDDFVRTVMEFEKVFLVFGDHSNVADLKQSHFPVWLVVYIGCNIKKPLFLLLWLLICI